MIKKSFLILLFLASCLQCKKNTSSKVDIPITYVHDAYMGKVSYMIFVPSFADDNGDGIGDLKGIIAKLPALDSLGITAIWLSPIHPSPSYHKYDVKDYKAIDPTYGTMSDFEALIQEAHRYHIKIYLDLVLNHTSNQHTWFKSSASSNPGKYASYYYWQPNNGDGWYSYGTHANYYFGAFSPVMPDLRLDNTDVQNEIKDITQFWLVDKKVDGFRLDAIKHYFNPPSDRWGSDHAKNIAYLKKFTEQCKAQKNDVYIIGEMLDDVSSAKQYLSSIPRVFNFNFWWLLSDKLNNNQSGNDFFDAYYKVYDAYNGVSNKINGVFVDIPKLSNHDEDRTISTLGNDMDKAKVVAATLLLLPGEPYIYYGEELGMKGLKIQDDKYVREPYLWESSSTDKYRTKWMTPIYNTDVTTLPKNIQQQDLNSIYSLYKSLIALRNQYTALQSGNCLYEPSVSRSVLSFTRTSGNQTIYVYINFSTQSFSQSITKSLQPLLLANGATYDAQVQKLYLPKYGIAVLQ